MKTALLVIASGQEYWRYADGLMFSAYRWMFPHDTILFTDNPSDVFEDANMFHANRQYYQFSIPSWGFPDATLFRYHVFCDHGKLLSQYDRLFYSDADMSIVGPVFEEHIISEGITAVEHPGFVGTIGTPETRKESTAYCPQPQTYFCGGFQGGNSGAFLTMAADLKRNIDIDQQNGIKAIWNDESHLNRYLYDNPPARILDPSYCYPEGANDYYKHIWEKAGRKSVTPKIVALTKHGVKR